MKYFNVAGPCFTDVHYMLNATERLHNELIELINTKQYFVIHAARQTGKTTLLLNLRELINAQGVYYALYCSLENVQSFPNPEQGIPAIINCLKTDIYYSHLPNKLEFAANLAGVDVSNQIRRAITDYCLSIDKPLIIFFDEADCLGENTLITFLRQLRNGFVNRTTIPFPVSIALVGMRNLRDYRAKIRENQVTLSTASPFNIIKESLTLRNFTKEEVCRLYQQHTQETGQIFEENAVNLVFDQTQGQPWLVNAIASEIIVEQLKKDYAPLITANMVSEAIHSITLRRDVHIDQLLDKLKEERVQKVIEQMIMGEEEKISRTSDDFNYVMDLGLIRLQDNTVLAGNPIYGEVIVRTLNYDQQIALENNDRFLEYKMPKYYKNDAVDMNLLLQDFQQFWRENSDIWLERFQYKEAAPHLIVQAFLQRVFNSGGDLHREMATGRERLDLCITYKDKKYPIEIKIYRGPQSIQRGIMQTLKYMDTLGCNHGWLLLFDRNATKSWEEKIYLKREIRGTNTVYIFGC